MGTIRKKKNYIPIPFEDEDGNELFVLKFSITDSSVDELYKQSEELNKITKRIEKTSKEANREQAAIVLKKACTTLFGEGAFDKLYAESGSIIITAEYYAEIVYLLVDKLRKSKLKDIEKELLSD